jgi:predicted metal-binding protein
MKVEVFEHIDEKGDVLYVERFECVLPISKFDHHEQYKSNCEFCKKYGKNLACPPYSPRFIGHINGAKSARVICLRIPLEYFHQTIPEEKYRAGFLKARQLLVDELLRFREQGFQIAGSGACTSCEKCAIEEGDETCKNPDERIYSLESLGVNVVALVQDNFDFKLEWSDGFRYADYVSAVGAVFLK